MAENVRFVRINGKIVPMKGDKKASNKDKKKHLLKKLSKKSDSLKRSAKRDRAKMKSNAENNKKGLKRGFSYGGITGIAFSRSNKLKDVVRGGAKGAIAGIAIGLIHAQFKNKGKNEVLNLDAKRKMGKARLIDSVTKKKSNSSV